MARRYSINEASPYWSDRDWNYAHLKKEIHQRNDVLLTECGYSPETLAINIDHSNRSLQIVCGKIDGTRRTLGVLMVDRSDERDIEFDTSEAKYSVPTGVIGGIASEIHEILASEKALLIRQGKISAARERKYLPIVEKVRNAVRKIRARLAPIIDWLHEKRGQE